MTAERKRPGVAYWATVVVVVVALLIYPLSQGPAGWLLMRNLNQTTMEWYLCFYSPLLNVEAWLDTNAPKCVGAAISWYLGLWR